MPSFRTIAALRAAPPVESITRLSVVAGAAAVQALPANPRRRALEIYTVGTAPVFFGFTPATNATSGFRLEASAAGAFGFKGDCQIWSAGSAPGSALFLFAADTGAEVLLRESTDPTSF